MKNSAFQNFDLAQLRHFYAVAHFQGFSRASRATGLSQPALSAGLKKLERELELQLINRTSTSFKLTEAGTALFEFCQEMDLKWSELRTGLTGSAQHAPLRYRIGTAFAIGYSPVARLIRELKKSGSSIQAEVMTADSYQLIQDLQDGKIDLALLPDDIQAPDLKFDILSKEQVILIASSATAPLPRGDGWRKQLASELLVTYPRESPMRSVVDRLLIREKLQFHSDISVQGVEAIKHLVLQGLGVAFVLKSLVADELDSGLLKQLNLPIPLPKRGITLAYRKNDRGLAAGFKGSI